MAEFSKHSQMARRILSGMSIKDASKEVHGTKSKALAHKKGKKSHPWQGDTNEKSKPYTFSPKN